MFRVKQSQIGPQILDGLFSPFNRDVTIPTVMTQQTDSKLDKMDLSLSPFKRRRRARRTLDVAGPSIRSTWF